VSIDQGDIFAFDFGPRQNHLMEGPHSVVIVQAGRLNSIENYHNTVVVPITSKPRKSPTYVPLQPSQSNSLVIQSYAVTNQIYTIDRAQLGEPRGRITQFELAEVKKGLAIVLDIRKEHLC
jgi:mRNA-degrading endonuclease toxin of MazEF toxin-antitoxin module